MLQLIDGLLAERCSLFGYDGFDFGNLAAGEVEKLDLVRGSNSTIWGSDAIGGVLLVVALTQKPGGYRFADIPHAVTRVIAGIIR